MTPCPGCKVWRLSDAAEALLQRYREDLQAKHRQRISEYEYALAAFGSTPYRHPCKHEFLILCWLHQWPDFQLERNGVVNHWAIRMAKGFCFFKRLNLMGCGSSGKTAIASAYVYTLWKSRPFSTSVFLSTTSGEAAQSRTWGQVKDWHSRDRYGIGKRIESLHLITLDDEAKDEDGNKARDFRNSIKVVLIKPGAEGKNVMAGIVGRKNDIVVWVVDEFPFMDIGILNARVNLNTNPFNQFIGLGNAPEEGDPMYLDAAPFGDKYPDGWRSVDKDKDLSWPTEKGHCLYFNGSTSPNFGAKVDKTSPPFQKLMNEQVRLEILKDSGGEDTPMYWKQFFGFPPSVDISDKVLTHKLLDRNGAFSEPLWLDTQRKVLAGLDLGFRADGDPCVIHFGRVGKNTEGRTVLATEPDGLPLLPKQGSKEAFEVQIAKQVIAECRARDCHDLALDVTGDGGVLLQHIEREAREQGHKLAVLAVSFSGTAEDRIVIPGEKRTAREMFQNMVAQLWGSVRVSVLNKVIVGMKERSHCTIQFCSRKMGTDEKKRMTVEKKSEMKKRLRRSPDHADACALLHHLVLRHGLSGMDVPKAPPKPRVPPTERQGNGYAEHATGRYQGR